MAMTWGNKPIMENVGTIEQVVVNEATSFSYTQIFAANTHGDIFEFQHAKPDVLTKIFIGNGTVASTLAHDGTYLFSVLNGTVFKDTSGFYIYQFFGGGDPWKEVAVNDSGHPNLIGHSQNLYIIYPSGILRRLSLSNTWEVIGTPGKKFVCNSHTVFGISGDDSVWQYVSGKNWAKIRSLPTSDIIAGGNLLCAVDKASGDIFQFGGAPNSWTKIGSPGKMFAIDDFNRLYGLVPDGSAIWHYNGQPESWTKIGPTPAGKIFAGSGVLCATSPDNRALWCYRDDAA